MRVLVVSESDLECSLGRLWPKALRTLGHDVEVFEPEAEMLTASRLLASAPLARLINAWRLQLMPSWRAIKAPLVWVLERPLLRAEQRMNATLVTTAECFQPQLVIVLKGVAIRPRTVERLCRVSGAVTVCFTGDDPFSPASSSKYMLDSIGLYDFYLIWSERYREQLHDAGAKVVLDMHFGFDPDLHFPEPVSPLDAENYGADVVFVGAWSPERERTLAALVDIDLAIWGNEWSRRLAPRSSLRRKMRGGNVDAALMRKIYRSSKIVLNILREQNRDAHNMRSFEIPAIGAFMLTSRSTALAQLLDERHDMACFGNVAELRAQVEYWLTHDEERSEVAANGHRKVWDSSSYLHRMEDLLKEISRHNHCRLVFS